MSNEVIMLQSLGGDGRRYHDGLGEGGMAEGGNAVWFFPMMQALLAIAAFLVEKAAEAQDAANTALNAPGTQATTSTAVTVSAGSKSITLNQTGKAFAKTQRVRIASDANVANFAEGTINAFNSGTGAMTVIVDTIGGSGTFSDGIVTPAVGGGVPGSRRVDTTGAAKGGGPLSGNLTIDVAIATVAEVRAMEVGDKVVTPAVLAAAQEEVTLQFGATITSVGKAVLDCNDFWSGRVFMAGNGFLPNLTNAKPGVYEMAWQQDGVGGRQLTGWGNQYRCEGGRPQLTGTPGAVDYWSIRVVTPTGPFIVSVSSNPSN